MPDRFYNAALEFVDANVKAGRGKKAAFKSTRGELTYDQLLDRSAQVGLGLSPIRVHDGDRMLLLMLDNVDYPVLFWGAIRAGMIPVPLNTLLSADQYRYIVEDSRAKVIMVSPELVPVLNQALEGMDRPPYVAVVDSADPKSGYSKLVLGCPSRTRPAPTCADDVAFWLYSSGSTGMPKGVKHVHSSLAATAELYGKNILGIREDDVVFSAAKLFFAYGLGNAMTFPMSVGATTILMADRPTPTSVFDVLRREQPTIFFGVPTLYAAILADPSCTPEAGSQRLRLCVSAGEALPEHIGKAWEERFGVEILDGLGSTEMLHIFVSNRPGSVRYGTSGTPVPGYEAKLLDESGAEAAPGEIGELLVRGPSAAEGYWNQREKSRRTFEGEWTRTGDKYTRDANGYYTYSGRTDDMFKVSGIWVSPFEVESALASHPAVLEAAVVPAEDAEGLLKPKAFIVLKQPGHPPGLDEELKEHVKRSIGMWKYPRWIEVVDSLPKTGTGKIQRFKLRSPSK
jgi:4-hydroxybenzoate-CoA ligase